MAKKQEDIPLEGAALMMEKMFLSGAYFNFKRAEIKEKRIKEILVDRFREQDEKRLEIEDIVCKHQAVHVYEWDKEGLNEYLNDHGVLVPIVTFPTSIQKEEDVYPIIKPYERPNGDYIRFYPNKNGKFSESVQVANSLFLEDFSDLYTDNRQVLLSAQKVIEREKIRMKTCNILRKERSMKSNFGTVKRVNNKPKYDIEKLYFDLEDEGEDILIQHGSVSQQDLDDLIALRIIDKDTVDGFKELIDIKSRHIVMGAEAERKQSEMLYRRKMELAQTFRFAG